MSEQMSFQDARKAYMKNLTLYVPVVARVHGAHHPEFHQVKAVFDAMAAKIKEAGRKRPELKEDFESLRAITKNYEVPGDVCESYEAVYHMLQDMDRAYHA